MSKGPIPERWIDCPRKATRLIEDKFLAFKTPLSSKFDSQVPEHARFPPQMLLESARNFNKRFGLWIDLTNTSRYYDEEDIKHWYQDGKEICYTKLTCKGRGEAPTAEQTTSFINLCSRFVSKHPLEMIGIHCTHGFNRTGFLIVSYLVVKCDWGVGAALQEFARARPPGIYKADYIKELFRRYDEITDAPDPPLLPTWCYENSNGSLDDIDDDDGSDDDNGSERLPGNKFKGGSSSGGKNKKRKFGTKSPKFMEGIPGVEPVMDQKLVSQLRALTSSMFDGREGFPGSQPVSMTRKNINNLSIKNYMVSWKADGTRYMMLITGRNEVYFIDRNNDYFLVSGLTFVNRKNLNQHLTKTLMDGEMVIDKYNNLDIPRYLIYDIVYVNDIDVRSHRFSPERIKIIEADVIIPRHQAMHQGKIDKSSEPFSVRLKEFFPIVKTKSFLSSKFVKQLSHEPDGLIFQPSVDPYQAGQCLEVLKWKPSSLNSVDFRMKICMDTGEGIIEKKVCHLYVGGFKEPFDRMPYKIALEAYNNKIIECKRENNRWVFMRERTDKSFPNSYATAAAVIESIKHPVTKEDLLNFIDTHFERSLMPPPSIRR